MKKYQLLAVIGGALLSLHSLPEAMLIAALERLTAPLLESAAPPCDEIACDGAAYRQNAFGLVGSCCTIPLSWLQTRP